MKRSGERILTTHVGSLARPVSLLDIMNEKENDRPYDKVAYAGEVKAEWRQVAEVGVSRATYAPKVHPTVVWPKFKALAEGARIASARLWN
jgi:hypothetical protein